MSASAMSETPVAVLAKEAGYWTQRRLEMWAAMSPAARDYDRYQGWYPPGQGACETPGGVTAVAQRAAQAEDEQHSCRCHVASPCAHCTSCAECFADGSER